MPYDVTIGNQLTHLPGMIRCLGLYEPLPYADAQGVVSEADMYAQGAAFPGPVMYDWEPYAYPASYTTGTIAIASGIVTGTGTTFPVFQANSDYALHPNRLYVNTSGIAHTLYTVASRQSGTQLTLHDTSVNVAGGTTYRYASFGWRRCDPSFNLDDVHTVHDEMAYAWSTEADRAAQNCSQPSTYDQLLPFFARRTNISNNATYAAWQADVETCVNYVTSEGFKIFDFMRERGGIYFWPNYVLNGDIDTDAERVAWRLQNQRMMQTLNDLGVANAPLFMRHTVEGYGEFQSTGTGTEVPDEFQLEMLQDVQQIQPGQFAWWGIAGQYAGYEDFVEAFNEPYYSSTAGTKNFNHLLGA